MVYEDNHFDNESRSNRHSQGWKQRANVTSKGRRGNGSASPPLHNNRMSHPRGLSSEAVAQRGDGIVQGARGDDQTTGTNGTEGKRSVNSMNDSPIPEPGGTGKITFGSQTTDKPEPQTPETKLIKKGKSQASGEKKDRMRGDKSPMEVSTPERFQSTDSLVDNDIIANKDFVPLSLSNGDETGPRKKLKEVDPLDNLVLDNKKAQSKGPGAVSRASGKENPPSSVDKDRDSANEATQEERISTEDARPDQEDAGYSSKTPWYRGASKYSSELVKMLHEEIVDFCQYISPSEAEHKSRLHVINCITSVITKLWSIAQVKVFGSFDTRLYLPTSDIDLVVLLDWPKDAPPPLQRLANALENAKLVNQIKVIDKARVPIIKLKDSIIGYDIDISFNIRNGIKAAEIIKEKIREFPSLRPLAFVIKQFLQQRSLNEVFTGGLSSYSVLCLIISFLQMHPRLQRGEIRADANLGVLLIEFFELYGRLMNTSVVGISIRDGGSYYNKSQKYHYPYQAHLISIEDPQDPDNDIAQNSFNFMSVKTSFEFAHNVLAATICEHYSNRKRFNESLLGKVIEISPQVIFMRKKIREAYETLNLD